MATYYFRITAYHPAENISVIMDSNGVYEKLWQFSAFMIEKGFKVIEVSSEDKFLDGNFKKVGDISDKIILRANHKGKPENVVHEHMGISFKAIKVEDKIYVPDNTQKIK